MTVSAYIKDYIAQRLESASILFAKHATEVEGTFVSSKTELIAKQTAMHNRVQEYASGAVIMAVAGIEGMVNELLSESCCDFARSIPSSTPMSNVSEKVQDRWASLWNRQVPGKGFNALDKCQIALAIADLDTLPDDKGSVQNLKLLITLRNRLVHSEPSFTPNGPELSQKERDSLERKLTGKFEPCQIASEYSPFIWERCLGAGCAQWAVTTALDFGNDFYKSLGIPIQHKVPSWSMK